MAGMNKSEQSQQSTGSTDSSGSSRSFIAPQQQGFLSELWQTAQNRYPGIQQIADQYQQQAQGLYGQGQALLGSLTGATGGVVDQVGEDIQRQLARQIGGAGGIGSQFQGSGTFGGSRQGIEQGLAQQGAMQSFAQEAARLRLGGTQAALSALPQVQGMSMSGLEGTMAPLQSWAGILGSPTVLSEAQQQSRSRQQASGKGSQSGFTILGG